MTDNEQVRKRLFHPDVFIHLTPEDIFLLAAIEAEGLEVIPDEDKTSEERAMEQRILARLREAQQISGAAMQTIGDSPGSLDELERQNKKH